MAAKSRSPRKKVAITLDALKAQARRKPHVPTAAGLAEGDKGIQVKKLQRYLKTFGYMASETLGTLGVRREVVAKAPDREGTFDDNTAAALRQFQSFNHLPVTGTLDEATLALMQMPRC